MTAVTYKTYEGFPSEEILEQLTTINQEIFLFGETAEHLAAALRERENILICYAFYDTSVIGFKVGFQERSRYFESWRGGVLPDFRGQNIAQELLQIQHEWCKNQGFKIIITTTNSQNTPMLIVNLRGGFTIIGTFINQRNIMKVMLQKRLVSTLE